MTPTGKRTKVLRVSYIHEGERDTVDVEVPDTGEPETVLIEEASKFVQTLEDNKQLAHGTGPLPTGASHKIELQPDGTKRLMRKRFTSV